ncbi:MAG: potassium transporter, partial [Rhodobacteraceae bacterium]|nr:potassium transporter [Paracoccaceae bacterium]
MDNFLFQATIYLAAAVIAVPLSKKWGLGSVLGYLFAGIIIGQLNLLMGTGFSDLHGVAEFGIIMLLFVIGLELEPKQLWQLRTKLLGLGGLQIVLTTFALAVAFKFLGYETGESIALGLAFSLSSTAMVLQTLSEKGLTQSEGGRSTLSVLLTQDVAFIPMLIIIPLLATNPT